MSMKCPHCDEAIEPEPPARPSCGTCPFFDTDDPIDDGLEDHPDAWKRGYGRYPCKLDNYAVFKREDDFCSSHPDMEGYVDALRYYRAACEESNGEGDE